jgi:predicted nuclease with TOPRIM domain
MFSQVASKIGKGVKIAENVVKIVQNPQEEVEKLTQRMNALLFQQSKLKRINVEMRKRLEYETAKLQQAEVEKDEIRDQYTLLKSELAGFEAQREAEMQKLYYLEQATNQAFAHVHSLQQIAGNSRSEAESLRAYTEGLSAQTESLLAYNQYLAYLLQQRDAVIVMQHHFIQQSQAERLALLSENARMSAAIEQFKKEKKDSISD